MTPMPPARLALAIQASLLLSFAGIASAQDAAPAEPTDQAQTLDTVTVTGTRIKKTELDNQVPVQALTRKDIYSSAFPSVADIHHNLTPRGHPLTSQFTSNRHPPLPPPSHPARH